MAPSTKVGSSSPASHSKGPQGPTDLPKHRWKGVVKRTAKEFMDDHVTDWAAALTYYAVLSLFPGLIVLVALLGVFGQYPETFNALLDIVRQVAPASAVETVSQPLENVIRQRSAAGALLGVGLLGAIWSASGYIGAFMRACNVIYEVEEGRPFWMLRPLQLLLTIVALISVALVAIGLVISGPVAEAVGDVVGLGSTAVSVWNIAKWPVLLLLVMLMVAVLFWISPNVKQPSFKWVSPGGIFAVLIWVLASVAFAFYVTSFGSYNQTYGSLGGIVIFLLWIWITNIALLLGAELDSEIERARELARGLPAEDALQLPPRRAPKED